MPIILLGFSEDELSSQDLAYIKELAPDRQTLVTTEQQVIEQHLDEIEIAVKAFPQALLARAPKLRWFQQWGAGADWLLDHPEVAASNLIVTSGSGIHAIPISEHILALLFAFGRALPTAFRLQMQHRWQSPESWETLFELSGKTMLLVGVGAIGERTAQIASALGVRVLGVRRDPATGATGVAAMYHPDELLQLLPQADFVVLTVPLTEETHHLFGEQELRTMKKTAYLINIGRGGTIDEPALVRALQQGWIAGAGLDVFAEEPLPPDSPLWGMENVIVTAHYAGATPHYHERAMKIFLDNLRRYVAGEPLRNVVDKTLGY
jgi:phosphoglycerate dehydrogenase-like enzyme